MANMKNAKKKIKVRQLGSGVTPSGFLATLIIDGLDNGDRADIDWGDNSEPTVIYGSDTVYHTYQSDELFTVTITAVGYDIKRTTFKKGSSEGRRIEM